MLRLTKQYIISLYYFTQLLIDGGLFSSLSFCMQTGLVVLTVPGASEKNGFIK